MSEIRDFQVVSPAMSGPDVKSWQEFLLTRFHLWDINFPLTVDGNYGPATRSATASFLRAWGAPSAADAMRHGVTGELRSRLRHDDRSQDEKQLFNSAERADYRHALRERYKVQAVCSPIAKILDDSWGYHPPIHDGVDLICVPSAPLMAIVTGRIIRADAGGWWGKGAPADPLLRAKGDGIIVLRATVDVGPFKEGMNFCYGHAEGAVVKTGEKVHAGQHIGSAGFANAWHTHFMVNDRNDDRGLGDRDPMPFVKYAMENS
jgi:murein DD-endopeptidase MepM/ murein hydrolase activator NlpD